MKIDVTLLTTYRASDRRVYNGALCSDMSKELKHTASLEKQMKAANAMASCTYFPMEGKYMTFVDSKILTGNFHDCKQEALIEAIRKLV